MTGTAPNTPDRNRETTPPAVPGASPSFPTPVPAVDQACRVLICLGHAPSRPLTLTEICRGIGIHMSKGHNILKTLMRFGLVTRDPRSKTYRLGVGLLFLSRHVLENLDYRETAASLLRELGDEPGCNAFLGMVSGDQFYVVCEVHGAEGIHLNIAVGHRFHVTFGAHGKALVAHMDADEQRRILARNRLYFYGSLEATRRRMKSLERELEQCRRTGYAVDPGHAQEGIRAVASPVFGLGSALIGAVVLIGTFPRKAFSSKGPRTALIAGRISKALGAGTP